MKKILAILVLVAVLASGAVLADGLFVKKKTESGQDTSVAPIAKTQPAPAPEPEIAPAAIDPAPQPPAPQQRSINDFANDYYANCKKQKHPVLKGEALEMLCGCTSAKIPDVMTVTQMEATQYDTPEGLKQRNRVLSDVYTPCIHYPAQALIFDQCVNNPQVSSSMKKYKHVCKCLADNMAGFMKENAPATIDQALKDNPENLDPLRALLESPTFNEASQVHMKACVMKHELGR